MKILQISEPFQGAKLSVIEVKTVHIKKVMSIQDMIALKDRMGSLKRAVKIG
jgi:hypothetical protein